jgi:deoxyribodipyrimidine photo-lyase
MPGADPRLRALNTARVNPRGEYVLYWMTAFRRLSSNFALDHAAARAKELAKPLLVFEPLRAAYPWASDRLHAFVLDGMAEHRERLARSEALYYPYVEPEPGAGSGLLEALAQRACLVVADDSPAFFYPHMLAAAAAGSLAVIEAVDGNGLLPLAATADVYPSAYAFRRVLQRLLPEHLGRFPRARPLAGLPPGLAELPEAIRRRWPPASRELLEGRREILAELPIDHSVYPVAGTPGGERVAERALDTFLARRLARYGEGRGDAADDVTSGLSPYLHFGHVSTHQVFAALAEREGWTPERLGHERRGAKAGFWGMSAAAEAFLDELVTWRELGFHTAAKLPGYDRYESLPEWARKTLDGHRRDPRPFLYSAGELAAAETHDELWNAAQRQLVTEGRIHNYLRMLWGKKILEWSRSPEEALEAMVELNNRYALDGRDPNSYSGILWCLGRYDRPWGPERPVFGTVRYMSSDSTRRKMDVRPYVARHGPSGQMRLL